VAALVAAGLVEEPDGLYLGRNPMRPEHDRLLPRSREGAGAGAGADTVRLLVPGFSYKTTAYVLWRRGARKPLQPTTSSPILTPQRATTEYTSPLVPRTSPPPPPPPPGARKLLAAGYEGCLIPVDDFLALTYAPHEAKIGAHRCTACACIHCICMAAYAWLHMHGCMHGMCMCMYTVIHRMEETFCLHTAHTLPAHGIHTAYALHGGGRSPCRVSAW
jgi:hypothetical protein